MKEDLEMHPWATPGTFAVISATDDGVGMDAETRARAFEPFYTMNEAGRGTGLGMAVTYGLMKSHSGLVTLYSGGVAASSRAATPGTPTNTKTRRSASSPSPGPWRSWGGR